MGFVSTSKFNSSWKGASVTLSGSDLVATVSSGTGSVQTNNKITGPCYFEMTLGATLSGSSTIGISNYGMTLTALVGAGTSSIGYNKDGTVKINNANVATIMTYAANDRIGVAVDPDRQLIWFRKNNGNWNNDVIANQNPVGAVGGISFSTMTWQGLLIAWGGSATASVTAAYASGSWVDTAPTGYSSNDTLQGDGDRVDAIYNVGRGGVIRAQPALETWCDSPLYDLADFSRDIYTTIGEYNMNNPNGSISGQTLENGTPVANKLVVVYDAKTLKPLGFTYSDGSGNYELDCAGRPEVFAVAFDPNDYQMLGYDRLTPA